MLSIFGHRNARACNIHIRAYSPCWRSSWSCVPSSTTIESFMYLHPISTSIERDRGTHKIKSACRVRFPNRWDENTIVLLPLSFLSRSNKSCSAVGSRLALGSSNNNKPTLSSSETTERMNVRERAMRCICPPLRPLLPESPSPMPPPSASRTRP